MNQLELSRLKFLGGTSEGAKAMKSLANYDETNPKAVIDSPRSLQAIQRAAYLGLLGFLFGVAF